MPFFTKKPVRIEARQITDENSAKDVADWIFSIDERANPHPHFSSVDLGENGTVAVFNGLVINTLEGPLLGRVGWWVIKGVKDEFYACEPEIFKLTYDAEKISVKR